MRYRCKKVYVRCLISWWVLVYTGIALVEGTRQEMALRCLFSGWSVLETGCVVDVYQTHTKSSQICVTQTSRQMPTTAHPGWNKQHPTICATSRRWTCFACWTRCDRQRLAPIRYRRGFCDSAHLFSPHRLAVCSTSHLRRVSCRASGRVEDRRAGVTEWLPANLDHAAFVAVSGAVRLPGVFLPGTTPAVSIARHQGSVRL